MKFGFIKTAAITPRISVGNVSYNTQNIIQLIRDANGQGAKLAVFPELCLTGYTCGDLFFREDFLLQARAALDTVAKETAALDTVSVVGLPLIFREKLYNCAAALYHGKIIGVQPKKTLPEYNEFYEKRQFSEWRGGFSELDGIPFGDVILSCGSFSLGIEICEDLWGPTQPSQKLALAGCDIIVNPSASNETTGKDEYRRALVSGQSARLLCGYVYAGAGAGESTGDMVFAGSRIIAENGRILAQSELFAEGMTISEIDLSRLRYERRRNTTFRPAESADFLTVKFDLPISETLLTRKFDRLPFVPRDNKARCELILSMQANALARRWEKSGAAGLIVGASGGLDSTLALIVAVKTADLLGKNREAVTALTMPCKATSNQTRANAEKLAAALGVTFAERDISAQLDIHLTALEHDKTTYDVTYENSQARIRTLMLMDKANQQNLLVIGTGDLSELALGWATYNGDHMSMYGVNCGVPKTLVSHLVKHYSDNSGEKIRAVLESVLATPISPELVPPAGEPGKVIAQRTESIIGPYELHDFFLYYYLRCGFSPEKVLRIASLTFADYSAGEVRKWLDVFVSRFYKNQFKRSCMPDGVKLGSVSLSPRADLRLPSDLDWDSKGR